MNVRSVSPRETLGWLIRESVSKPWKVDWESLCSDTSHQIPDLEFRKKQNKKKNHRHFDLFLCVLKGTSKQLTPKITGRTRELCRWPRHNHKTGINTWTKWVALSRSEAD